MFRDASVLFLALSLSCAQSPIHTLNIYPFAEGLQSVVNEYKGVHLLVKFMYFWWCIWQTYKAYSSAMCSVNCGREQKTLKRNLKLMLRCEI